jgi:amino acid transporter
VVVVAIFSLAKTWNAVIMMASRLVLAQARAGLLPAALARVDSRRNTPTNAILLVTAASVVGIFLGRGALVPIVNMATICVAMTIVLMLLVLVTQRRRQPLSPGFSVPLARVTIPICVAGATLMAAYALVQPLWTQHGIPLEWQLIAVWATIGWVFRRFMTKERHHDRDPGS